MAALVAEDPDAGADEALQPAVEHPGDAAVEGFGDGGDVGQGGVGQAGDHGEVTEDIVEGGDERGLEAVGGDGVPDGLNVGELLLLRLLKGAASALESEVTRVFGRDVVYLLNHDGGRGTLTGSHVCPCEARL